MIFQARISNPEAMSASAHDTWCAETSYKQHHFTCIAPDFDSAVQGISNMMARQFAPDLEDKGFDVIDLAPDRVEVYVPALATTNH